MAFSFNGRDEENKKREFVYSKNIYSKKKKKNMKSNEQHARSRFIIWRDTFID